MDVNLTFDEIEQRIQSLTTLLSKLDRRRVGTPDDLYIPEFLQDLATLFTCDERVAVTGTFTSTDGDILVAKETHPTPSNEHNIGLQRVEVATDGDPTDTYLTYQRSDIPLNKRISWIWRALSQTDFTDPEKVSELNRLVLAMSFEQLCRRFASHELIFPIPNFGEAFYHLIWDWEPSMDDTVPRREVKDHVHPGLSHDMFRKGEWEFGTHNLQQWSRLLSKTLGALDAAFEPVDEDGHSRKRQDRMLPSNGRIKHINDCCEALHVMIRQGIVKSLLLETSLGAYIDERLKPCCTSVTTARHHPDGDTVTIDIQMQKGERRVHQVLRYLEGIVSWHEATYNLRKRSKLLRRYDPTAINVCIVEQTVESHPLLPLSSLCKLLGEKKSSGSSLPDAKAVERLLQPFYSDEEEFQGSVHPEATLLGLITHYNTHPTNYDVDISKEDSSTLSLMLEERDKFIALGVNNQCCYCCHMIGRHEEEDTIDAFPGTHGIIVPWTPPRVGVKLSVLRDLEKRLLRQLESVVRDLKDVVSGSFSKNGQPPVVLDDILLQCQSHSPHDTMSLHHMVSSLPSFRDPSHTFSGGAAPYSRNVVPGGVSLSHSTPASPAQPRPRDFFPDEDDLEAYSDSEIFEGDTNPRVKRRPFIPSNPSPFVKTAYQRRSRQSSVCSVESRLEQLILEPWHVHSYASPNT